MESMTNVVAGCGNGGICPVSQNIALKVLSKQEVNIGMLGYRLVWWGMNFARKAGTCLEESFYAKVKNGVFRTCPDELSQNCKGCHFGSRQTYWIVRSILSLVNGAYAQTFQEMVIDRKL